MPVPIHDVAQWAGVMLSVAFALIAAVLLFQAWANRD